MERERIELQPELKPLIAKVQLATFRIWPAKTNPNQAEVITPSSLQCDTSEVTAAATSVGRVTRLRQRKRKPLSDTDIVKLLKS